MYDVFHSNYRLEGAHIVQEKGKTYSAKFPYLGGFLSLKKITHAYSDAKFVHFSFLSMTSQESQNLHFHFSIFSLEVNFSVVFILLASFQFLRQKNPLFAEDMPLEELAELYPLLKLTFVGQERY